MDKAYRAQTVVIGASVFACLSVLGVLAWGTHRAGTPVSAPDAPVMEPATMQPMASLAPTPSPVPTLDYIATNVYYQGAANAAQSEAEAQRLLAIAAQETAVASGVEIARIELERDHIALQALQMDASATAMWVTATAQAAVYTATSFLPMATIQAGVLADREAQRVYRQAEPTRAALLLAVEQSRRYGWLDAVARCTLPLSVLVLGGGALLAVLYNAAKDRADRERAAEAEAAEILEPVPDAFDGYTPVVIQRAGYVRAADAHLIPCTPEQLTEFAGGVLSGSKSTAIRQWEGAGTAWNRRTYANFLGWMLRPDVGFATDRGTGTHALTAEGEAFLHAWVDSQTLPHSFVFNPETPPATVRDARERENHARESGGGVGEDV